MNVRAEGLIGLMGVDKDKFYSYDTTYHRGVLISVEEPTEV